MNKTKLHAFSEREFQRQTGEPVSLPPTKRFRAMTLNLARYDASWDRKRGAAARLMAVVLRESDEQLTQRVCASPQSATTYRGATEWLAGEAQVLRKHVRHLESAAGRLAVVLQRCEKSAQPTQ